MTKLQQLPDMGKAITYLKIEGGGIVRGAICPECQGTGINPIAYSCCGDDITGTEAEDYGLCPSCLEHLCVEHDDCEYCEGTGKTQTK